MTVLNAIILGIVQGAAEFLPISSSGHLVIVSALIGEGQSDLFFGVLLHLGTFFAIVIAFWRDILRLIIELFSAIGELFTGKLFKTRKSPYRNYLYMMIISLLPLFLVLPFRDGIESLFSNPVFVGGALIVTGFILQLSKRIGDQTVGMKGITLKHSLIVGFSQLFAIIPGISRSGSTITAGLAAGFKKDLAVKYSFIISLPATLAAGLLELYEVISTNTLPEDMTPYFFGMAAAAITGWLCIFTVRKLVQSDKFYMFSQYCFVVGTASIIYFSFFMG